MSEIQFDKMTQKTAKTLYEAMWKDNAFLQHVPFEKAKTEKKDGQVQISENSYRFTVDEADKAGSLIQIFGIKEPVLFRKKFLMACGGSGQEYRKINTLHSSSLCALLFFYRVTEEHPLTLTINGKAHCFTDSVFEFQSPVFGNPSNMDVVLVEKHPETGKATLLFLESKFSEYYSSASPSQTGISNQYRKEGTYSAPFYHDSIFGKTDEAIQNDKDGYFKVVQKDRYYIGGIKQMISHYTGIRNLLDGYFLPDKVYSDDLPEDDKINLRKKKYIESLIRDGADFILAEILFTDRIGNLEIEKEKTCLSAYQPMYQKFADKAAEEIQKAGVDDRFSVASEELGYDLFRDDSTIEPEILAFYFV